MEVFCDWSRLVVTRSEELSLIWTVIFLDFKSNFVVILRVFCILYSALLLPLCFIFQLIWTFTSRKYSSVWSSLSRVLKMAVHNVMIPLDLSSHVRHITFQLAPGANDDSAALVPFQNLTENSFADFTLK